MKKSNLACCAALGVLILSSGGCDSIKKKDAWVRNAVQTAGVQLRGNALRFASDTLMPRSLEGDGYKTIGPHDWTSGFFPGTLWLQYELSGDRFFETNAAGYTARLKDIPHYRRTHDLGFMLMCSYGNQYRITGDTAAREAIIDGARTLNARFDPAIGLIRSWDFGEWHYPVIIDNMMNLEMLFEAARLTGDTTFYAIAVTHADNTMRNHFRDDNSSFHLVSYNDDGSVECRRTFQGYSDDSSWARGQAWGLYGYTMCYRETGYERYLEMAEKIAGLVMNHPRTPADLVPYWDYDAPDIPHAPRDASAGAIIASALFELVALAEQPITQRYSDYAEKLLMSLSSPSYLAQPGTNGDFILMHSVGNKAREREVDTPLNYADYYYLEALKRYLEMQGGDESVPPKRF